MNSFEIEWVGTDVFTRFPIGTAGIVKDSLKHRIVFRIEKIVKKIRIFRRIFGKIHQLRTRTMLWKIRQVWGKIRIEETEANWSEIERISKSPFSSVDKALQVFVGQTLAESSFDLLSSIRESFLFLRPNSQKHVVRGEVTAHRLLKVIEAIQSGAKTTGEIAKKCALSETQITHLLRLLRQTDGTSVFRILERLHLEKEKSLLFTNFLSHFPQLNLFLLSTMRSQFEMFQENFDSSKLFTFDEFRRSMLDAGFKNRQIHYEPLHRRSFFLSDVQKFFDVLAHIYIRDDLFEVVFIDESSVCPSNFKKRAWFHRGESNRIQSNLKYESVMMVGAITRSELISFQVLRKGHDSKNFLNFVRHTLEELQVSRDTKKLIVFFLDNATVHYSSEFFDFTSLQNCVALFNLPGHPELNPIEMLWEKVKRHFRSMTTYEK